MLSSPDPIVAFHFAPVSSLFGVDNGFDIYSVDSSLPHLLQLDPYSSGRLVEPGWPGPHLCAAARRLPSDL
jgi:hypothetical protein